MVMVKVMDSSFSYGYFQHYGFCDIWILFDHLSFSYIDILYVSEEFDFEMGKQAFWNFPNPS